MGRAQVEVEGLNETGVLERLFEGITVEGYSVWFNVVHDGMEESSPVTNIGGQYGAADGKADILLQRAGDSWLDLVSGENAPAEPLGSWEQALPWVVVDGTWREVRRQVVVAGDMGPSARPVLQ